jgi:hypothetical protein
MDQVRGHIEPVEIYANALNVQWAGTYFTSKGIELAQQSMVSALHLL